MAIQQGVVVSVDQEVAEVKEALKAKIQSHGSDHPTVIDTMVRLARAYARSGEMERAEKVLVRAIEICAPHGHEHPSLTNVLKASAIVLKKQHKYQQARGAFEALWLHLAQGRLARTGQPVGEMLN